MDNKPICYVPSRRIPEVYSGVTSFLGLPPIRSDEELRNSDFVVLGVPWEGICTYGGFTSCEMGPKYIRKASARYGGYMPEYDIDIFDHFTGGDLGDLAVKNGDYNFSYASMREGIRKILNEDKFPIVLGGDHSISYPLISEFAKKYNGKVGIIHFDAHMDNMESFGDEKYARCSPFYNLYQDENINPKNIVHYGIRGPRNNPAGIKTAREVGATVITGFEAKTKGIVETMRRAIEIAKDGTEAVYVTVCSDILDIANNPAGPPDPCGFTTFDLALALHECGLAGCEGFDIVEFYPPQDPNNISGHVAVWMTLHLLAGLTIRKLNRA